MNTIDSGDFTTEDIIELMPSMSNGLIKNYMEFESRITNSETNCRKYHSIIKEYRNFIGNFPSMLRKNIDQLEVNLRESQGVLEEKKAEVEDLLKIENELTESVLQNEQKVESLREKISHSREKIKNLEEKRDKILAYKLLTNTSFCYEGPNVSGYVADPKTKNIKCFNLDPEKLSQQAITDSLYEIIREVSLETSVLENVKMNREESEENC